MRLELAADSAQKPNCIPDSLLVERKIQQLFAKKRTSSLSQQHVRGMDANIAEIQNRGQHVFHGHQNALLIYHKKQPSNIFFHNLYTKKPTK